MSRRALFPTLAVAATFVGCLFAPMAASAASITTPVCSEPSANHAGQIGFVWEGEGPFALLADCPDLTMTMSDVAGNGGRVAYSLVVPANLASVAVTLSGGPAADSGVEVSLRVCSFEECGRRLLPSASGLPADEELTLEDGIPAGPVTLLIKAECVRVGGCDVQPDTIFSNLRLTVPDDVPPYVEIAGVNGDTYAYPDTLALNPGENGQVGDYVYVNASDIGSSPKKMWWTFDDGPIHEADCALTPDGVVPVDCGFFDGSNGMIMPPNFVGVMLLTVYVEDQAGNVGSRSVLIKNDPVAPDAPAGLSVGANDAGWITHSAVTTSWSNPNQPADSENDPGVTSAHYSLSRSGAGPVDEGTVDGDGIDSFPLLVSFPGYYELTVYVTDAAGNESDPSTVSFSYDAVVPVPPNIAAVPVVNSSYDGTGLTLQWSNPDYTEPIFSGVCEFRTAINSLAHFEPTSGAGVATLPNTTISTEISPEDLDAMSDGVRYFHVAATSCAGTDGPAAHAAIVIDRHPPRVTPDPVGGGWLAPGKPLILRADDSDPNNSYAGVAKIKYKVGDDPEQTVNGPKATIQLTQGMHTINYSATDIAGNESDAETIQAGIDAQAPNAAFGDANPADPALVTASVTDLDSGVGDAWLEYRSPGSPTWARLIGTSDGGTPRNLQARFPDDDSLPTGEYNLRIVARDNAGNLGTTTSRVDGSTASLNLPLRRHPVVTLAVAPTPKAPASSSLTVPFGATVIARGTLRDLDGSPLAGAPVAISESISGGRRLPVKVASTDAAGAFSVLVPGGPSRVLTANFRGDALRGSATASATFNVRARITLKEPPKSVKSGKRFYLRGKVNPGLVSLPKSGARVQLQHRSGSRWSGLVAQKRTASDGTFEFSWSQKTGGRAVRMAFRASVETEAGWPYAQGYSKTRTVVIR